MPESSSQDEVPNSIDTNSLTTAYTLYDVFFGPDNIEYTMRVLFDVKTAGDNDFLTQLLGVMCTHSVQFQFTDHGLTPFVKLPLVIIPYSQMSRAQLQAVDLCLQEATRDLTKFKVGSLMGGGSSVNLICLRRTVLDTVEVLFAMYKIIVGSKMSQVNAGLDTSSTFNLILQRLVCSIGLPREQIISIRQKIFALH